MMSMKVAYLVNQYPKVSHTFIRREIHALRDAGQPVERYALRGWDAEVADPLDESERSLTRYVLRSGPVPVLVIALLEFVRRPFAAVRAFALALRLGKSGDRSMLHHLFSLAEAAVLVRWTRRDAVQHLHAHFGTNTAEVCLLAHVLAGLPYSFTIHGPDEWDQPRQLAISEKVRRASFVVAISSYTRSQVLRWCRIEDRSKVVVIHCGPGDELLDAPAPAPSGDLTFVCIGRLCVAKSQTLLVEAVARVVQQGHPMRLVLVGDGEMRADVEASIREHRMQQHVQITGWASEGEVQQHLRSARALVLPSLAEGLPVAIMEAMALGRPVLATYVGGIPELVRDGKEGWLVPPANIEALVDALVAACSSDEAVLAELGGAARTRVRARHRLSEQAKALRSCFARST